MYLAAAAPRRAGRQLPGARGAAVGPLASTSSSQREELVPVTMPAAAEPPPAQPRPDGGGAWRRTLLLAAAVATVWALFLAGLFSSGHLFLVKPPITRRSAGYFEFDSRDGCSRAMAQGAWTDNFRTVRCTPDTAAEYATCADVPQRHWRFAAAARGCGARRLGAQDARQRLHGQLLVFAGDSIARNLYGAALRLLGQPGQDIVVGHADFEHDLEGGIGLRFFWAPYPANLTAALGRLQAAAQEVAAEGVWQPTEAEGGGGSDARLGELIEGRRLLGGTPAPRGRQPGQQPGAPRGRQAAEQQPAKADARRQPALLSLSATLWHLLHVTAADDFGRQLGQLKQAGADYSKAAAAAQAVLAGGSGGGGGGLRLVLTSGTETFPNRMKTAQKQRSMTPAHLDAYNQAVQESGVLAPGGPFALLDLFPLTRQCGEECSPDGVHSVPQVYDAALQILLNQAWPAQRSWQDLLQGVRQGAQRRRRRLSAA